MSRLPKPELRMPEIKLPAVLEDLFYDLRDRRLFPFVALVVVALAAAPFLLSDSGSDSGSGEEAVPPATASGAAAPPAQLTVVETDHGLREPDKRLAHLSPKDPFRPQFTGPSNGGAEVAQTSTSTSASTTSTSVTSTTTPTETSPSPAGGSGGATPPSSTTPSSEPPAGNDDGDSGKITIFTFAIDLKIVKAIPKEGGGTTKKEAETRQRVLPPAPLPGRKTQALTYIGISPKTQKPLFMVSEQVSSVFGEAECVAGSAGCQLLEAEPHFPLTVVYGPNDVRYKLTVLDVEPVATGHT